MRRFYDTGAYTHHIGDEASGLFGLCEGSFGVMVANRRAGLLLGHIFRRGAWFGQGPLLTRKPRGLAFRAMEPSTVLYLPLGAIDLIARELPDARRRLMSLSEYNQATVIEAISDLLLRRADERIAALLLRLCEADTATGPVTHVVTQAEMAEMSNVSRPTANAVLRRFARQGAISIGYGTITVTDAAALEDFLAQEA
ncbi:CRP-like cAMP-binding protein [Pseudoroseicyclus aestuarii]|uniref:CRP-like cAMP-binding protein n=2 Tax=Pseudoroseicyclus aestuarii TaxID=1795041 RepID=A0A318T515_9RHOB|nr:CRP-like cAMP-binding protein [Pseudoroseicyclus aestuarii]